MNIGVADIQGKDWRSGARDAYAAFCNRARRLQRGSQTRRVSHQAFRFDWLTNRIPHDRRLDHSGDVGAPGQIARLHDLQARFRIQRVPREASSRRQNRYAGIDRFGWLGVN